MDEFEELGRDAFLRRYGYGKSRDFLVRNPHTGVLCDSKAIVGVAYGKQFAQAGPLAPADFSGGEATVVPKLQSLGFETVRIGEDWSEREVDVTLAAYFEMLDLEGRQIPYNKSERNAELRRLLSGRSKAAVELKHQNISAILNDLGLPFINGYKPRGNAQLLLRKAVQQFVQKRSDVLAKIVDSMEEMKEPGEAVFRAVVVDPPPVVDVVVVEGRDHRVRIPRKIDLAARDEGNRRLGRSGEQWVLGYEQHRLIESGSPELFDRVEWISDKFGDGAGYDILSYDDGGGGRYIEVKTTNGPATSSFMLSRNELEFAREVESAFFLYRVFQFRTQPRLFMLQGDPGRHLHLEPMDYRASFRRLVG